MANITVTIIDMAGNKRNTAKLPDDAPMNRLLPALVTKLNLPPGNYKAMHKESGKELGPNDTLAGAGVQENHTLRLVSDIQGGKN